MEAIIITISIILCSSLLFFTRNYFLKRNIVDKINIRSSHTEIATRSGGIAIYFTLLLISIYYYFIGIDIFDYSLLVPLTLLLMIGLYDDVYNIDFKLKFIFQIVAAKILIDNGYIIENFHGILGLNELNRVFAQVFSMFIIVATINSINFIDGIDGLAASVISIFIILFEFFSINNTPYYIPSIIVLISFIPFLYFNVISKNKVFLGDSGSLFLGGLVSVYVLHILSSEYLIQKEFDINKVIFVVSILSYPIIDIIRVFFIRVYNGKSPFEADKNHIHHIILNKFKSHIKTTLFIILLMLSFSGLIHLII
tara:strand:+ start:16246 stop:17178 length:933 start_codon:yes stop_codon:yes gene_type:complete